MATSSEKSPKKKFSKWTWDQKVQVWDLLARNNSISSIKRDFQLRNETISRPTIRRFENQLRDMSSELSLQLPDYIQTFRTKLRRDKGIADEQANAATDLEVSKNSIDISASTLLEGINVLPHISASLLFPIPVSFSLLARGTQPAEHVQIHVWLPHDRVGWSLEKDSTGWESHGQGPLAPEFNKTDALFAPPLERWVYQLSALKDEFLMPSSEMHTLPLLWLSCRRFSGTRIFPWKLEATGYNCVIGTLALSIDEDGRLTTEFDIGLFNSGESSEPSLLRP